MFLFTLITTYPEEYDDAINAWKESIALQPSSPDAHTSASFSLNLSRHLWDVLVPTDLASAYIISPIARPDLALQHLQYVRTSPAVESVFTLVLSIASSLAPEDPEIAFNLAAVLEACTLEIPLLNHFVTVLTGGRLEDALTYYKRSKEFGVERAALHIRNVRLPPLSHLVAPHVHRM